MLGIFDSGLGGLTVLGQVRALLPHEDLVYFGDQAHAPYGDRSAADLQRLLAANLTFLESCAVDAIVMGCNTSCAVAARHGWPPTRVPVFDLIDAAVGAVEAVGARRIGVIATAATTDSGAYAEAICRRLPLARVEAHAAPALVPLVEAGVLTGPRAARAVADACAPFARPLDALVLACTHYPLLDGLFAQTLGPDTIRIDPAVAQARRAAQYASGRATSGRGATRFITSGPLDAFASAVSSIAGIGPYDRIERLEIPSAV